jgi:hypothetical protein
MSSYADVDIIARDDMGQLRTGRGVRPPLPVRAGGAEADLGLGLITALGHVRPRSCSATKGAMPSEMTAHRGRSESDDLGHDDRGNGVTAFVIGGVLQTDVRAAPARHEVEDIEYDIVVAVAQPGPERLELRDDLFARHAGLQLVLCGPAKILQAVLGGQGRMELVSDRHSLASA